MTNSATRGISGNRKAQDQAQDQTHRNTQRHEFIGAAGWAGCEIEPLMPDASHRSYYRLKKHPNPQNHNSQNRTAMLMDAPPPSESVSPFVALTQHLQTLKIRCPAIYCADHKNGFLLIEDLGDATFTKLLAVGFSEKVLYIKAVDTLIRITTHADATQMKLNSPFATKLDHYALPQFLSEARLFVDWYLPAQTGKATTQPVINDFLTACTQIFQALPALKPSLTLRDFHVDNLMIVKDECAVLDYQDALIGSCAYDLVSLLEDARRDLSAPLQNAMLERFLSATAIPRQAFMHHYIAWGVQRHLKVAGIFTRLSVRDHKPQYLKHLDRVRQLIQRALHSPDNHPALAPLREWSKDHKIDLSP